MKLNDVLTMVGCTIVGMGFGYLIREYQAVRDQDCSCSIKDVKDILDEPNK